MKKKGSICEFNIARDEAILGAYRRHADMCDHIRLVDMAEKVAATPCGRFYVSEERAKAVVSQLIKGNDATAGMNESKRRMFSEIHRRVARLRRDRPRSSLSALVSEVVNSPAPEMYLSPRYIYDRLITIINSRIKSRR